MEQVVGIKFNGRGNVYQFSSGGQSVAVNDSVIAETEQGVSLGVVVSLEENLEPGAEPSAERGAQAGQTLVPIVRLATEADLAAARENETLAKEAVAYCRQCIRERNLDMKLVDVEVFFDRSKMVFFFTAPARIDFRDLVKDLVHSYRTRIELRQIGVRHETQMIGALGNCGMVCCCRRYLQKFAPVTIKMAKEQNLFLNPAKISGICGRLLCCLSYEQDNYEAFHRSCPRLGKRYQTSRGMVKILRSNMFRNSIVVFTETGEEQEFTLPEWAELAPRRTEQPLPIETGRPQRAAGQGGAPHKGTQARAEGKPETGAAPGEDKGRRPEQSAGYAKAFGGEETEPEFFADAGESETVETSSDTAPAMSGDTLGGMPDDMPESMPGDMSDDAFDDGVPAQLSEEDAADEVGIFGLRPAGERGSGNRPPAGHHAGVRPAGANRQGGHGGSGGQGGQGDSRRNPTSPEGRRPDQPGTPGHRRKRRHHRPGGAHAENRSDGKPGTHNENK